MKKYKRTQKQTEHARKMGISNKGRKLSPETIEKMRGPRGKGELNGNFGKKRKPLSVETRLKISLAKRGDKSNLWRGGVSEINKIIRNSLEYKLWRTAVFTRDNFTCVWCGHKKSNEIEADHIKPFALYPELRFSIDNGRTLCKPCHRTTDTYGKKQTRR